MRTGYPVIAFPAKLLECYKVLGLTDADFLNVLAILGAEGNIWSEAAKMRGYSSPKRFQTALKPLVDRGLILIRGDTPDLSPLFASVMQGETVTGTFTVKPKRKSNQEYYAVYNALRGDISGSKHLWAESVKQMVDEGYTVEDITGCTRYLASYYRTKGNIFYGIRPDSCRNNIDAWIGGGRKAEYKPERHEIDLDTLLEKHGS